MSACVVNLSWFPILVYVAVCVCLYVMVCMYPVCYCGQAHMHVHVDVYSGHRTIRALFLRNVLCFEARSLTEHRPHWVSFTSGSSTQPSQLWNDKHVTMSNFFLHGFWSSDSGLHASHSKSFTPWDFFPALLSFLVH